MYLKRLNDLISIEIAFNSEILFLPPGGLQFSHIRYKP